MGIAAGPMQWQRCNIAEYLRQLVREDVDRPARRESHNAKEKA